MTADYERIREENIARYGWDTAVLDLLGHLYSERTHFIFELIQNAEDAGATSLSFDVLADRLEVRHDGRPFTEADVRAICGVARSDKAGDLTRIGQFGIGFKAVYAYTKSPHVYSAGENFRIERYVRPFAIDPVPEPGTLFVFPFDLDTVPPAVARAEIDAALAALRPTTLLFLRDITSLAAGRTVISRTVEGSRVRLSRPGHNQESHNEEWLLRQHTIPGNQGPGAAGHTVAIAFRLDPVSGAIVPSREPLFVFLPTQKETFLGFAIQGPYRTTPARDNIGEHDPGNERLAAQTATLLVDSLRALRDENLLTPSVLGTLPLDPSRFAPGTVFRPLYDAVREALRAEPLIPLVPGTGAGSGFGAGHGPAGQVMLAADPGLPALLNPRQLGALYGADGPRYFADADDPSVRRYLRDQLGVPEVSASDVLLRSSTAGFLAGQPDEWIARFYAFLHGDSSLWRQPSGPVSSTPLIRLEDGTQVTPFTPDGRPAAYLPGATATGFPVVRRAIADDPAARRFLVSALGLTEPDVTDEVLELVLPRYHDLDAAALDKVRHDADLELIFLALDSAPAAKRDVLVDAIGRTPFLIGENAATGAQRLSPPGALYERGRDLELYFDQNPDAWFVADRYGPWLVQLRPLGVRQQVTVTARSPDLFGHVLIADQFARHERGLDGFDPDATIEGLEFALRHPGDGRSEYVWNSLLSPNRRLLGGVVEKSVRDGFLDSVREETLSAIAVAARREAWLPAPDGSWRRPAELSLDDLPRGYTRDETLARVLGMAQPVVAQAARQLGIPAELLWALSSRPDLITRLQQELKNP